MSSHFRQMAAVAACQALRAILHLAGRGGTTLPGRIAALICPDILAQVSTGMQIVAVTGTNGKTSSCRMLQNAFERDGKSCLLNRSGANLASGITAELVCNIGRRGIPKKKYAVIECDEGALRQVVPSLRPRVILVTNLFRDQLDRYGEVMTTREKIRAGLALSPEAVLCLNADCPLTASLADGLPNPAYYYGIDLPLERQEEGEISDARYCPRCGGELVWQWHTYAHLGGYDCPACGKGRPRPQTAVRRLHRMDIHASEVQVQMESRSYRMRIGLPAVYNIYNALAAVSVGSAAGLSDKSLLGAAARTRAPFGRLETFDLAGIPLQMILVKNPAGCNQAIDHICRSGEDYGLVLLLNDRTADGHDISWIWDADYERIAEDPHRICTWVSGIRAEDMQLRLKYAGASKESICMEKDYHLLIGQLKRSAQGGISHIFVLPNYTSMLDFRKELVKETGGHAFWRG